MKYKAGDRVKIKTWAQMEKEYIKGTFVENLVSICPNKDYHYAFTIEMEENLAKIAPNRIVEIKRVSSKDTYYIEGFGMNYNWMDFMIEGIAKEEEEETPPLNRFQLIDID